jgi:hypothetical protein
MFKLPQSVYTRVAIRLFVPPTFYVGYWLNISIAQATTPACAVHVLQRSRPKAESGVQTVLNLCGWYQAH